MKATEQYFYVGLMFIILYKVVLTFESVDDSLKCDHLNNNSSVALSCPVLLVTQCLGSWTLTIQIKAIELVSYLMLFSFPYKVSLWMKS